MPCYGAACLWTKTNSSPLRCAIPSTGPSPINCFASRCQTPGLSPGCLVQTVWNVLTRRAVDYGINDYDVFYFDPDTSWEAEDAVIRKLADALRQARHQGRGAQPGARPSLVSGETWPALSRGCAGSTQGIDRFLTRNTQIGIRGAGDGYEVYAPNGYDDVAGADRAAESGSEFLGGELRSEGGAVEDAVAGDHGAAGGE